MTSDWKSNDAAKRVYRRFNQPDHEKINQLLKEARDSDGATQQQLIEKLIQNVDIEETLNELDEQADVSTHDKYIFIYRMKKRRNSLIRYEMPWKEKMRPFL